MSVTFRQNRLLVAEDWKKIYQSFKNADFQSYDFENLRRTMIDYIRINYPEDYNDYIESSEYLALIDLIAFLGQSVAFRVDLNARDNFLELSERREAVLRLARMISYNSKRNNAAKGLLKFATVTTTENVIDSNGRNISGQVITWNDPSNTNWYDQFIKVLNAAFPRTQQFGNPADKSTIYGIPTQKYQFNSNITGIPVFGFTKSLSGRITNFEIVSTTFTNSGIIDEEPPKIGNIFSCIYRDDGRGPSAPDSGFFVQFVQGSLNQGTFSVTQPSSNQSIDIDATNINNTDVWLYRLNANGIEEDYWTQVSSLEGNNIIYNSVDKKIRNIYSVISRAGDAISLQFSDGVFGNLPLGTFRTYYRVSNGLDYRISPQDMRSISISIPYISGTGQDEILSISMNLTATVSNATASETNDSIKANAPATYYTQNRMITGEDYNISPLSANTQVVKIKSLNRTSTGVSRYYDLTDPTGKYSSTNLFADDGVLYTEEYPSTLRFSFQNKTDIEGIIYNTIFDILRRKELKNFYYSKYINYIKLSLNIVWNNITADSNACTGYIGDATTSLVYKVGSTTANDLKYFISGSLVKFEAPVGYYFDTLNGNNLVFGDPGTKGAETNLWAEIVSVENDGTAAGTGTLPTGFGPIMLNINVPDLAKITQVIPKWRTSIETSTITSMIDLIFSNKPFGLRYSQETSTWQIVYEQNLDIKSGFSLSKQGDVSNQQLDASWLLLFSTDNEFYTVTSRECRYIFESDEQIQFYYDKTTNIYDITTNKVVKDNINVLSINTMPNSTSPYTNDQKWDIVSEYTGADGYIDSKKIIVTFADSDNNGVVDNPELFFNIVTPYYEKNATGKRSQNTIILDDVYGITKGMFVIGTGIGDNVTVVDILGTTITLSKDNISDINSKITFKLISYIIEEKYYISADQEDYRYVNNRDNKVIVKTKDSDVIGNISSYLDGQCFYFTDSNVVKKLNLSEGLLFVTADYKVYVGRDRIKFQYTHSAEYESRIDPGSSNIIDIYVLTKNYDITFRQWISGADISKPLAPSSDELNSILSPSLNLIKSVSDEIIFHPVQYKILFGATAPLDLQATFKVVKNTDQVISDNDIKSRIITAINEFFDIENWDFGDTFYFIELSTYIMNKLAPDVSNFAIVPRLGGLNFGNLFEIKSASDQILISGATVDDIEIVSSLTPSVIKALPTVSASTIVTAQQNITSSAYGALNG